MTRQKSAVLSAADKKSQVKTLKDQLKAVNDGIKQTTKFMKDKQKLHDAGMKAEQKKLDGFNKTAAKLAADIAKLNPAPVAA